jgi:hypothetical protein
MLPAPVSSAAVVPSAAVDEPPMRPRNPSASGPNKAPPMTNAAPMRLCSTSAAVVPAAPASLGHAPSWSSLPEQPGANAGPACWLPASETGATCHHCPCRKSRPPRWTLDATDPRCTGARRMSPERSPCRAARQ